METNILESDVGKPFLCRARCSFSIIGFLTILRNLAGCVLLAVLARTGPIGLAIALFLLWLVLLLSRRTPKLALLASVAFGLSFFNCLKVGVTDPSELSRRASCQNHLKEILLAMHNYSRTYGTLPPANIADAKGKPAHSWRVLLLPYLDHAELYKKYSFEEPWDGPNNRALHNEIVHVYSCPSDADGYASSATTSYVVVTGQRTAFPGSQAMRFKDIAKPLSQIVAVIEVAGSGIPWMAPRDIAWSDMDFQINGLPDRSLSSRHGRSWEYGYSEVFNVGYLDGHVESLPLSTRPEELAEMLTVLSADKQVNGITELRQAVTDYCDKL